MRKTFKYRLRPTSNQVHLLEQQLEECRNLYNHFLEHRRDAYTHYGVSLGMYDQMSTLPKLKEVNPPFNIVHSQVLQNVAVRIELAFQAFFRRVKTGEKPGYPRFRGKDRYDSMTFPQWGSGIDLTGNGVRVSKIGTIKITIHRPLEGKPKTGTILRTATGKWYLCVSCENVAEKLPAPSNLSIGIDVGIKSFAVLSDETIIENPKFFRKSAKALAKAQRKLELQQKGSSERKEVKKIIAKIHEKISDRRSDFAHQVSRKIVNQYGKIFVEDIEIDQMNSHRCMNRSIRDVAWSQFFSFLSYKAVEAGREFKKINPAYTSQDCSSCGHRQKMPLSERTYHCPDCGMEKDRDHNASLNILRRGLASLG